MLMETEFKKLFAIEFTKYYKQLQKDFIIDDHERSISITALSVQIFTVPTLARQLIEEGNVIKMIVGTVMELLREHLDSNNRFFFLGYNSDKFSRIQIIFHDLRYILISKPSVWTEELRREFLEGFKDFLGLLKCMQGMEEVKHQFGQHIAVEPEWEAAFSLQIQLRHILAMFQDWCSSDVEILLLAFEECHKVLMQCNNQTFHREAINYSMLKHILHICPYKVSQEPERFDHTLLAEHPLRCVVLAAQVSAEMWRRNGLSLVSQVYYYQDVKCRDEMYDKDILMLQVCGSERYVPGISHVTKEDVTMREVIHLLCIEPMAHSSLVKGLPENESHETGLETVITKVATFKYAEESQKKRRAQEGHDKALCPPVPPAFCPAFSSIVRLLSCDVLIHILRHSLQRAAEDRATHWTEAMIQRALHLMGQALLEEKAQLEESTMEEVAFDFSLKARRIGSEHGKSVFALLSKIKTVPSLDAQKDMVKWVLQMFEIVKCLREKSSPTASMSVDTTKPEESVQDKEKAERKRKAEAAKVHRQKIMAQMSAMQKNFIESNKMLYDNMPESLTQGGEPVVTTESCAMEHRELRVAIGPHRGSSPAEREVLTCILCQEEQEVAAQAAAMVLTAYFEAVQNMTRNRLHAELIIDLENGEYLCPLCKSLCNTVVPLIPFESENAEIIGQHLTLPRWIQIISARIKGLKSVAQDNDCNTESTSVDGDAGLCGEGQPDFRSILSYGVQEPRKFSESIVEMLVVCATTVHRVGLQTAPNEQCPRVPLMAWNTWCGSPAVTKALKGKTQTVRCPNSTDDDRKHPTLCLFCGAMLCSQSSCCLSQLDGEDVGACTAHAATCGAGVGMFLRIRECEIVLMASRTRGSTYPAPYLDDYGETDPHLGRGNPLHICPERYRKLNQLWQQHCILEEIARSLEVGHIVRPVVRFRGGGDVDVGVSVGGCVDLVALAEALDDVQVGAGRFHEAVFQQPAVGLGVEVALPQHVLQRGLEHLETRVRYSSTNQRARRAHFFLTRHNNNNDYFRLHTLEPPRSDVTDLKQPGEQHGEADGAHDVGVVLQQRLAAASHPQVERLGLVLVVEVRRVVGHVLLDAGPRGVEVAAAEGDAGHQRNSICSMSTVLFRKHRPGVSVSL
ncbi:E3 ubiquitin-protein ligase UBR1 [Liparis tanakae]|uniref:E3 ubiquitin-protein ligase n=1 Tax=Liparis tanakae TaxID=230148 RepID=A0A4Z2J2A8_9TELE|nr:E3 ubiquitin-protein ligase UBR1 [Liparis tanakae]